MTNLEPVYVHLEFTPNPNTLKYSVNRTLLDKGAMYFTQKEEAKLKSPLADRLLSVDGIKAVMIGRDFITVTKDEIGDWDIVHKGASSGIEEHLSKNEPVFHPGVLETSLKDPTEIEKKIIEILDAEIRPAVAMDGGDITFEKFEGGIVYLYLQGSCAGCPSSTMTLKMGIETRLKQAIPEVVEVVSV